MEKDKWTVGSATAGIVDGALDKAGVEVPEGDWLGIRQAIEKAMGGAIGGTLKPRLGESITIHRLKGGPSFYLAAGIVVMALGIVLLILSVMIMASQGAAGLIHSISAIVAIGMSGLMILLAVKWLLPGETRIDARGIRFVQEGVVRKAVDWSERVEIHPCVNHAFGYNHFYGFYVKEGKLVIYLSRDRGWPIADLRLAALLSLKYGLEKNAAVSKVFLKVQGLWRT